MRESTQWPEMAELVVVGGGFAGLGLAAELGRRGGPRPVILEAGPDAGHEHSRWTLDPDAATRLWLAPETDGHFWRPYHPVGRSFADLSGLRRRLGGRSLYWGGSTLPIEPWALSGPEWPTAVVRDLTESWEGGEPLYQRVGQQLAAWAARSQDGLPPARHAVEIGGYRLASTPEAIVRSAETDRWKAYSPLEDLPPDTDVYCDTHVLGVRIEAGRVVAVQVARAGEERELRTSRVVLAGGTVENSRLAIQAMTDAGLLARPRLPGLVDKIAHGFVASFAPGAVPAELRKAAEAGAFLTARREELRSNLFLRLSVNRFGVLVADAYLLGEQTRGEWGSVSCEPATAWPWPTSVECELGPQDVLLAEAQKAELRRFWGVLSEAVGVPGAALSFEPGYGSADLPRRLTAAQDFSAPQDPHTYSFPLGSELHEAGTLPLGEILDDRHQVRGIEGLYVAGPACFPRTGAANPVLTILALSARLAGLLSEDV